MATTYYIFDEPDIATATTAYYATVLPAVILAGGLEAIYSIQDLADGTENLIMHVPSSVSDPIFASGTVITPQEYQEKRAEQSIVKVRFKNGTDLNDFLTLFPFVPRKTTTFGTDYTLIEMTTLAYELNRFDIITRGGVRL